jgi:peptide/nickel transport system permease protein
MRIFSPVLKALAVIVAASMIVFAVQAAVPGNPASDFIGPQPNLTTAERNNLVRIEAIKLGLNRPLPVRYLIWLGHALRGDFGNNLNGENVRSSVLDRLGPSLELAIAAIIISIPIATLLAVSVVRRRRWGMWRITNSVAIAGLVMPPFWLGILLVLVFCVWRHWLPASGYVAFGSNPLGHIRTLILPVIVLAAAQVALYYRYLQQSLRESMQSQYIRTAWAKGLSERRIIYRHALPNSLLPSLTILGVQLGSLIGSVVVVERIFDWPGVGSLLLYSVQQGDYNTVTAIVLAVTIVYVVMAALVDLAYRLIDPRIRRGR